MRVVAMLISTKRLEKRSLFSVNVRYQETLLITIPGSENTVLSSQERYLPSSYITFEFDKLEILETCCQFICFTSKTRQRWCSN